jgi:molybdate transport system substrate-binding protein
MRAAAAFGIAVALWGCEARDVPAGPERVTLFAAASLAPVLTRVAELHEARTGDRVVASFASSALLAKQIDAGAPADVFVSADTRWIDWLAERHRTRPASSFPLAKNTLVIVAPRDAPFTLGADGPRSLARAFAGHLALGDPEHVPLGAYARQALESCGAWEEIAPRVIGAADARGALALVERGECAAGILYASDAKGSERITVVAEIPGSWHEPIVYVAAVVSDAERAAVARFLETLRSAEARSLFAEHGFGSVD